MADSSPTKEFDTPTKISSVKAAETSLVKEIEQKRSSSSKESGSRKLSIAQGTEPKKSLNDIESKKLTLSKVIESKGLAIENENESKKSILSKEVGEKESSALKVEVEMEKSKTEETKQPTVVSGNKSELEEAVGSSLEGELAKERGKSFP